MSSGYTISAPAAADLDEALAYYLSEAGPDVAEYVSGQFQKAFRFLVRNPRIGHRRADLTSLLFRFASGGFNRTWLYTGRKGRP